MADLACCGAARRAAPVVELVVVVRCLPGLAGGCPPGLARSLGAVGRVEFGSPCVRTRSGRSVSHVGDVGRGDQAATERGCLWAKM